MTWRNPARSLLLLLLAVLVGALLALAPARAADTEPGGAGSAKVTANIFWQIGCPHCTGAKESLQSLSEEKPGLKIRAFEVSEDPEGTALFLKIVTLLELRQAAVPLVVIGDRHVVGYMSGGPTHDEYAALIDRCLRDPCVDIVGQVMLLSDAAAGRVRLDPRTLAVAEEAGTPDEAADETASGVVPRAVEVPLLGEVSLAGLSLPVLTVLLAGIDGFNPCAMWVLVLLIGLLAGVADSRRMWTLGIVFLGATGIMYFAVMAAWLNIVMWLGAVLWIRLAVGALAVGAGLHYLRDYWTNVDGVCEVTSPGSRKRITDAFRNVVRNPNLALAAIGIAGLAIAVNLIELVCSAGVPAVYTQVLAMNDLSVPAYYGYLLLYLVIFLLDDMVIFATAMLTLRSGVLTGRYSNISHAVGGGLLLALGAIMLLRPEMLG